MTYVDPNAKVEWHEPVPESIVTGRAPDTGRVTTVKHVCRRCGRLISNGRHVG